jgi:aminoglycoside phosphotransferase family enzyme
MEKRCAICDQEISINHHLCSKHYKEYGVKEVKDGKVTVTFPPWLVELIKIERHNFNSKFYEYEYTFSDLPNFTNDFE